MKNIFFISFLIFISILYLGCDDNNDITETQNGYYWGGNVKLWTENGSVISDGSGVQIYLEGTNFRTLTDHSGNWKIYNIPAGTYNLVAKKDGFGYHKFIDFEYLGGANANHFGQTLIATPTYLIDSVEINMVNDNVDIIGFPSNIVSNIRFIMVYIGKQNPIYDSTKTFELIYETNIYGNNNFFTSSINNTYLLNNGFNSGDTVHIAIYPGARFVERYFVLAEYKLINSSGIGPIPKRFNYILQ